MHFLNVSVDCILILSGKSMPMTFRIRMKNFFEISLKIFFKEQPRIISEDQSFVVPDDGKQTE